MKYPLYMFRYSDSGVAPDKITIPDLLLSKWEIVGFMLQKQSRPLIKSLN